MFYTDREKKIAAYMRCRERCGFEFSCDMLKHMCCIQKLVSRAKTVAVVASAAIGAVGIAVAVSQFGGSSIIVEAKSSAETGFFDTSGQIGEEVLYNDNNVVVTAEELVYTDTSVDLVLQVDNSTDGYISVVNYSGASGALFNSLIGGYLFHAEVLGGEGDWGEGFPVGTSEMILSYSLDELMYSGVTGVPGISTYLCVYTAEASMEGATPYHTEYIDDFTVDLTTTLAGTYDEESNTFQSNVLSGAEASVLGYTILASSTEFPDLDGEYGLHVASAAFIEEGDGALTLLVETDYAYGAEKGAWYILNINGESTNSYEGLWRNITSSMSTKNSQEELDMDGYRLVYRIGITAADRTQYGVDNIKTVSLTTWNGEEVLSLSVK